MAKPSQENFYKKLRYFSGINESTTKETNHGSQGTLINVVKSNDGTSYGIVKENHHYYIKKSTLYEGHKSSDFIYISGLQNKTEYQYNSLAEADKQRNFYVQGLNEAFSLQPKNVVSEEKKTETINNPFQYIRDTVSKGKTANKIAFENTFKKRISENVSSNENADGQKKNFMNETAVHAIRKSMGLVTEDKAMTTEDSEIKDGDILPNKTGKEKPQASINDSNAQKIADKAMGKGSFQGKLGSAGSIAVNQAGSKLKEEASPLVTDDSLLIVNQSLANMDNATKEKPQAPINDGNAKAMADKAVGKAAGSGSLPNDTEASDDVEPFDDKEEAGQENDDVVSESKVIITKDSEQKKSDEIANSKKKIGKPEAPYNSYNQPNKGHTEKKGTELKPLSQKGAIVTEVESIITADSEENPKDSLANKTNKKLPNPIAESDSLIYADSTKNTKNALPNKTGSNMSYGKGSLEKGTSYKMNDNAIAEAEEDEKLDSAMNAVDDLDIAIDNEKEAAVEPAVDPMADQMGGGEMPTEDPMADPMAGGEMPVEDPMAGGEVPTEDPMAGGDMDAAAAGMDDLGLDGTEELPAEGGSNTDEVTKEIKSLSGKIGELVRGNPEISDNEEIALEIINQTAEPFNTEGMSHGTQQKIFNKIKGEKDDMGGEPAPEGDEMPNDGGELPVPEVDVPDLATENCSECGTFQNYAESRGYTSFKGVTIAEVANVLSGYVNAFNEGKNDGDFKVTSRFMTEGVVKELKEYGHNRYISEAILKKKSLVESNLPVETPPIEGSVETMGEGFYDGVDMDTVETGIGIPDKSVEEAEQLDELGWRDIKNAAAGVGRATGFVGNKAQQAVGQAQQGLMNKAQQATQYVGDKAKQVGQYVGDKAGQVKQQYHQGAAKSIIQNIQQDAAKLGQTISNYNAQAQKAGGQPVPVQSVLTMISNQIKKGGNVNLSGHKGLNQFGEQIGEGGEDFASMAKDVDMGENPTNFPNDDLKDATFAPSQTLGVTTGRVGESEEKLRKYVQNRLEELKGNKKPLLGESQKSEKLKKLDRMIDEQWALANKFK